MLEREVHTVSRIASNLHEYVERSICEEYYASSSHAFFDYVKVLCDSVKSYLKEILDRLEEGGIDPNVEILWTNDLLTIKNILGSVHRLVKNTTEANILMVPFPLVALINRMVKNFAGVHLDTRVLVMSTDEYTFYHDPISKIREIEAEHIFPSFPRNLGFICFPFLESANILANCTLFHELGHYAFFLFDMEHKIRNQFSRLFDLEASKENPEAQVILAELSDLYAPYRLERKAWRIVLKWAAEIFSDCLACSVVGPAFFYNFWLLQHSLPVLAMSRFDWSHPAFLYRLSKMYSFLRSLGLSHIIPTCTPTVYKWLSDKCGVREKEEDEEEQPYELSNEVSIYLENSKFCKWVLALFNKQMAPFLSEHAKNITAGLTASKEDFWANNETINNYLEHFIVPSVLIQNDGEKTIPSHPSILTSATIFYLNDIQKWEDLLGDDVESMNKLDVFKFFYRKLNDFVMKAMTDVLVLRRENGNIG